MIKKNGQIDKRRGWNSIKSIKLTINYWRTSDDHIKQKIQKAATSQWWKNVRLLKYQKCLFLNVHDSCSRQLTWKRFWAGTWRSLKPAWRWRRWPSCCTLLKRNFFSAFREKQRSVSRRFWEIRQSGIFKNSLFFEIDKSTISFYKWFNNPFRNVFLKILKCSIHFLTSYMSVYLVPCS